MKYTVLKHGSPLLSGIEDLDEAKEKALAFVNPVIGSEHIEVRDEDGKTVRIG